MASVPITESDNPDSSFDEEVFFGPLSDKEAKLARRLLKRRTELYMPAFGASRPSLAEFREANNFSPVTEDEVSGSSDAGFVDSLEEKCYNIDNNCNDSGIDNKPCMFIDVEEDILDGQIVEGNSICNDRVRCGSPASEVDNNSTCLEDSLNDCDRISTSRIEHANDSLEIHSRRQSSLRLSNAIIPPLYLFENEESKCDEVVPESSFEQDSMPENRLAAHMELLVMTDDGTGASKISSSQSCNSSSCDPADKRRSDGIDVLPENLAERNDATCSFTTNSFTTCTSTTSSTEQRFYSLSSDRDSILLAPPASAATSFASILSEECEFCVPEHDRVASGEMLSFQDACVTLVENEPTEIANPLMSAGIAEWKEFESEEYPLENSAVSVPTDSDAFPNQIPLKNSLALPDMGENASETLESRALPEIDASDEPLTIPLENVQIKESDVLTSHRQIDDLEMNGNPKSEDVHACLLASDVCEPGELMIKSTAISLDLVNSNAEAQERCSMVQLESCRQSVEHTNEAVDQGCQTSFLSFAGSVPAVEEADRADKIVPPEESGSPARGTTPLNQKARRIPIYRVDVGQPLREPVFKTPMKPALRAPSPCCTSANKTSSAQKASPLRVCTPTVPGNRLTPLSKSRFAHIVSPVSKYIRDSAVPPLISNSRPIVARSGKARLTPGTKIPLPTSSSKRPQLNTVLPKGQSQQKRILVPSNKYSKTQLPVAKARNKLDFAVNTNCDCKENSSVEDSILEELKLSINELKGLTNKKLKKDVLNYVKTRKAMIVNAGKEVDMNLSSGSGYSGEALPCFSYKGASSLAMKQVDLVTKLHTVKNKNVVCSPCQPTILKHTGERKVLHWANGFVSDVDTLSSPFHPKIIAPAIYMKTMHKKSTGSVDSDSSTVDVSIVEVVNPMRTNTLAKQ